MERITTELLVERVHHEEAAAFMATGYAKTTGRLGVCLATSGPGGIHLLNGLYDAKLDHVPVLAITGMQETQLLGTGYQQEVHLERLYQDVATYNMLIQVPTQLPALVDVAVRHALADRGVAHLTIPNDVQEAPADADPWRSVAPGRRPLTAPAFIPPPGVPREGDLRRAAEVLNRGGKVAMLVGTGALGARQEVLDAAEALASPIVKTLPGKAMVPDDHPLTTGGLGLLGTAASEEVMEDADTMLMVGTTFPYTAFMPDPERIRTVQVEADPVRAGNRMPTEVPLVGDAAETLRALLPLLERKRERGFPEDARRALAEWRERQAALENPDRQCIAFVGDGGFAMLMAEFDTAARYHLPIKVVVCNNGALGQILWEQMVLGYPEFGVRFSQPMNFAPFASSCGGLGIRVEKSDEVEPALRAALDHPGPALVDVMVNPDEPPMPGKVSYEQAKGFAQAWLRGQPRRATIASTLFPDKLDQLKE